MKTRIFFLTVAIMVLAGVMIFLLNDCSVSRTPSQGLPRVFVFTDINIDSGDPDDRQSLIHLFWYANELKIEGVVPDRWGARGYEACQMVTEAYRKDYAQYGFAASGYPGPDFLQNLIAKDTAEALRLFSTAAADTSSPLYVLVWGNMEVFNRALLQNPEYAKNIRLITIGTGPMMEHDIQYMPADWKKSPPCEQLNWNGFGRNELFHDPRFHGMWWIEMNWTYAGMFSGEEPRHLFSQLAAYGALGRHIHEVVKNESWAQYFRVGDTPSVLYVLDPGHNPDDPTQSSWAGQFIRPFPQTRPHYYTDYFGTIRWNYENPCATWENHLEASRAAAQTLEMRRAEMYEALLNKLNGLYGK